MSGLYDSLRKGHTKSPLQLGARAFDGGSSTFSVDRDEPGQVSILRETSTTSEVAHFGFSVASVGTGLAAERGLAPWKGVLVTEVSEGHAADLAGIRKHDLLMAFDDVELTSEEQIAEFIAAASPGDRVVLRVSRADGSGGRQMSDVPVDVGARTVSKKTTERMPFATEPVPWRRAGIEVFTVPAELAVDIWDATEPVTLVTHVVPGSPGYLAGIRSGDRVVDCNGYIVEHARDISTLMSESGDSVHLAVHGDLGPHESRVDLVDDISDETGFDIPILIDRSTKVDRSSTSVLDFIFQFGFNNRKRYLETREREPAVEALRVDFAPRHVRIHAQPRAKHEQDLLDHQVVHQVAACSRSPLLTHLRRHSTRRRAPDPWCDRGSP